MIKEFRHAKTVCEFSGISGEFSEPSPGSWQAARKNIGKLEREFDMVLIDAAKHEYSAKVFAKEMEDYLDYVRNSGLYNRAFHDFGFDGMEVSIKI